MHISVRQNENNSIAIKQEAAKSGELTKGKINTNLRELNKWMNEFTL